MTYKQAEEIGKDCGLTNPSEFVNNIIIHSLNFFAYEDIKKEIDELEEDARKNKVEFSTVCGCAIPESRDKNIMCNRCTQIQKLRSKK